MPPQWMTLCVCTYVHTRICVLCVSLHRFARSLILHLVSPSLFSTPQYPTFLIEREDRVDTAKTNRLTMIIFHAHVRERKVYFHYSNIREINNKWKICSIMYRYFVLCKLRPCTAKQYNNINNSTRYSRANFTFSKSIYGYVRVALISMLLINRCSAKV